MNHSHKRLNILTNEWVLVSPHRMKRPWQGKEEKASKLALPSYDESCYLCPGNTRANGKSNPNYKGTYVFDNDFAALQYDIDEQNVNEADGLLVAQAEKGICKVVCYSPNHAKTMADLIVAEIQDVIDVWQGEYAELGKREDIDYVQIFENKGSIMGCSNPHPHGQIWAQQSLPNEIVKKQETQQNYYQKHHKTSLENYVALELKKQERVLFENDEFVIVVPYWAVWPFETMILPKKQQQSILDINETALFAEALSVLTKTYDKLFDCSFPYSCGIHQAPTNGENNDYWHWHMSFYPPLLRSATVKKFMVGYEMFGMPQRDITAEAAALQLKQFIK